MKKTWAVMGTAVAISAMIFTGCGSSDTATSTDTTQESGSTDTAATDTPAAETKSGDFSGLISPISREEGSGTRGAFIELFGMGFLSGMVNYLVLLWDGRPIRDAVMSVITSLLLPGFFIHTAYLGRLEYAEELKYEDIGDDKDKDV